MFKVKILKHIWGLHISWRLTLNPSNSQMILPPASPQKTDICKAKYNTSWENPEKEEWLCIKGEHTLGFPILPNSSNLCIIMSRTTSILVSCLCIELDNSSSVYETEIIVLHMREAFKNEIILGYDLKEYAWLSLPPWCLYLIKTSETCCGNSDATSWEGVLDNTWTIAIQMKNVSPIFRIISNFCFRE